MKKMFALSLATAAFVPALAFAASTLNTLPAGGETVTNYYKQSVYDTEEHSIGKVDDVLVNNQGNITALVIGVGGFLGVGEKDVAVPFSAVKLTKKNDKWWLTLDETKDSLKSATGYKYDKATTTWVIEKK